MRDGHNQQPDKQAFGGTCVQAIDYPIQEVVIVEEVLFVEVGRKLEGIRDSRFPVTLPNTANDTVYKLLDRTGPASAPCHSAGLALSLVGAQFVDTHALGQPQGSRKGDVLVETLFQQHFACKSVGDGAAESAEACRWICQVVQPLLAGRVSQRQSWWGLEGIGGLQATGLLSLL